MEQDIILNISTYKFIQLHNLEQLKADINQQANVLELKGTIIIATEGINIFLAATNDKINKFFNWLSHMPEFNDIAVKESYSSGVPFRRMIVKIKPEIITMRMPVIRPQETRAPAVKPETLDKWLEQGHDDQGRPVVMMDTRNDFEVQIGSFNNAINYKISKFTDFAPAVEKDLNNLKDKTVVSFCTGGIRCEKAAIYMQNLGLNHVYQLDGGILKYFEDVGGKHYNGECFVFDYRTALNPELKVSNQLQCYACRAVLTAADQQSPLYQPPKHCPHCYEERKNFAHKKQQRIQAKIAQKMAKRQAYCLQQKAKYASKTV